MKVNQIIIDGRHGGLHLFGEYTPTIRIPVTKESQISMGEHCDKSVRIGDEIEYQECFRSSDKMCVLYSTSGNWKDMHYALSGQIKQTYPFMFF